MHFTCYLCIIDNEPDWQRKPTRYMAFTESIKIDPFKGISTLTVECIIHLHSLLSRHYGDLPEMEPVSPPGIKDKGMLESAVMRQQTGSLGWYKYSDPFTNCSTLVFGLIKNHPFFNGNKRVALLALIKHLYCNGFVLNPNLKMLDLYALLIAVADGKMVEFLNKHDKKATGQKPWNQIVKKVAMNDDETVEYVGFWLKRNSINKDQGTASNTKFAHLREILKAKGIEVRQEGAKIILWQEIQPTILGIRIGSKKIVNRKEYSIGNTRTHISKVIINSIRKDYGLSNQDGFDNASFFNDADFIDEAIIKYKRIIYKLSRT